MPFTAYISRQRREIILLPVLLRLILLALQSGTHGNPTRERRRSGWFVVYFISREAEQKYVEYVTKLSPTWLQGGATHSNECEGEGEGISSSSSSSSTSAEERGFGMKVSTMQIG